MKEISFDPPEKGETTIAPPQKRSVGSLKAPTLRTYSRDVESLVRDSGITRTQVVMAEEERREARGEHRTMHDEDSHLTRIIFVLFFVLVLCTGVGAYVLIGGNQPQVDEDAVEVPKTERMYEVNIHNTQREQIIADTTVAFSKTSYNPNESRVVVFTSVKQNGKMRDANIVELFNALSVTPIPEKLARSIDGKASLHIYGRTILDPLVGALSFDIRSYPNAFAGMLEWERVLARDILLILRPKFPREEIFFLEERQFSDERIFEIDARVLKNDDGTTILAYMFLDKTHLVIAGNTQILTSLVEEGVAKK